MRDSSKMLVKDQEKFLLKKRISKIITIFLILQLLEFFILEAPNSFRELSESGYFSRSAIIFLLFLVACIKLIKSFISHYFIYITIMNALFLLLNDPDFSNHSKNL